MTTFDKQLVNGGSVYYRDGYLYYGYQVIT